jgi:hypothetical protein
MASIFVVTATVLAIVNGQPVHPFEDGDVRYDVTHQFPTREACEAYHHSDAFKFQMQALVGMVIGKLGDTSKLTITDVCHEFIPGSTEGSPMLDKDAERGSL